MVPAAAFVDRIDELRRLIGDLEAAQKIFLISPRAADDEDDPLERVLELLPDLPVGKLAIAEVPAADRNMVAALERAGFDAVLVPAAAVADLVGAEPSV